MRRDYFLISKRTWSLSSGDKYGGNFLGKEGVVKEESKFIKIGLGICAEGFQEPSESKVIPFGRVLLAQFLALVVVGFSAISLAISVLGESVTRD